MIRNQDGTVTFTAVEFDTATDMLGDWEEHCETREDYITNTDIEALATDMIVLWIEKHLFTGPM